MKRDAKANGFPQLPQLERGVPMPKARGSNTGISELIRTMKVGDSFVLPIRNANSARTMFYRFYPMKFATRKEGESLRIWRTE